MMKRGMTMSKAKKLTVASMALSNEAQDLCDEMDDNTISKRRNPFYQQ
jgi:hypothetical protein